MSGKVYTVDAWSSLTAKAVEGLSKKILEVKLGADEEIYLARDEDGTAWSWGASASCGPTPEIVAGLSDVTTIDCGDKRESKKHTQHKASSSRPC